MEKTWYGWVNNSQHNVPGWTISLQKLSQWMKDQDTALEVQTEIMLQLESWTNNDPHQTSNKTFSEN